MLGLIFVAFGLNGFLNFLPMRSFSDTSGAFMMALVETGYFFPLLKLCEFTAGIMILTGRMMSIGLLMLAPITVNVFLFHVFLEPGGIIMGTVVLGLELFLVYANRAIFMRLLDK